MQAVVEWFLFGFPQFQLFRSIMFIIEFDWTDYDSDEDSQVSFSVAMYLLHRTAMLHA